MVPRARIELATQGFSVLRSTTELPRPVIQSLSLHGNYIPIDKLCQLLKSGHIVTKLGIFCKSLVKINVLS